MPGPRQRGAVLLTCQPHAEDSIICPTTARSDERLVEVWTPEADLPAVEREGVEWLPEGAAEPFVLSVPELLRPV